MKYGYCRISTTCQNEDRQIIALTEAGVPSGNIISDQKSGKDFDRPGYKRLCRKVKEGDEIYIKSIDRLGRNYNEILEQWRYLTKVKKVGLVVLDMPPAGYPEWERSHRGTDLRYRAAAVKLCSADGTGVHTATSEGGHCGGKSPRCALWKAGYDHSRRV